MPTTLPLLDFDHQKGFEIPKKYKEATRQLYNFANTLTRALEFCYKLVHNRDVLIARTHRLTEPDSLQNPARKYLVISQVVLGF